ncbi:MAG: DUF4129 domain-containing protein [Thermoguttaceae bacterium]|jgi:hypothetical protein|nr:DUF4129 domain-containing protein [Thermoguttaceae bacterium]
MMAAVPILMCLVPGLETLDEAVDAGRGALGRRGRYPWYDARTDSVRRIDVREDPPPRKYRGRDVAAGPAPVGAVLQVLGWVAIAVLLALLVGLMIAAWRAYVGNGTDSRAGPGVRAGPNHVEALPLPPGAVEGGLLDQARRLYEQGDFSRAMVFLFAHQLSELDRLQIIRLARGKTNRQYMREVGRRMALRQLVEQTMVAFEDAFFGNRSIDRARFDACWARVPEFDTLTQGGAT